MAALEKSSFGSFAMPRDRDSSGMRITIKFFAILRDVAGTSEMSCDFSSGLSAAEITNQLQESMPGIGRHRRMIAYAVNEQFVSPDTQLHDGDVLALIPPVSGG